LLFLQAESRLAAHRAARAEARDVRVRELERQRKEEEEKERSEGSGDLKVSCFSLCESKFPQKLHNCRENYLHWQQLILPHLAAITKIVSWRVLRWFFFLLTLNLRYQYISQYCSVFAVKQQCVPLQQCCSQLSKGKQRVRINRWWCLESRTSGRSPTLR
jgi:hypothetical protein